MIAILQSYSSMLLGALGKTLLLTLLSLLFAMIIGMIFALMNVGRNRVLNCIGTIYVDAVRGVPLIVLAYFIYFGVPSGMKMMGCVSYDKLLQIRTEENLTEYYLAEVGSAEVGSSASRIFGFKSIAAATPTRCCMPPDSSNG